ncbi:MAG TPA: hypothetical protein VGI14_00415 [Casimicrobiaceae bacterium]
MTSPTLLPRDILHVVFRAAIPLAGVLWLDWSAGNLLFVYLADTLASVYVVCVLTCGRLFAIEPVDGPAWWRRSWFGVQLGMTALMPWLVIAVPFAAMMAVVLSMARLDWASALHDRRLWLAVAAQFGGAVMLLLREYRFVLAQRDADWRIKRAFGLAFLRWAIVLVAGWALLAAPRLYGVILVAVASLVTVALELYPDRVLRAFGAPDLAEPRAAARVDTRGRR